ncbi:MAG: hypothetical protein AAB573_00925 [Patescibacteria group bacterium]
MNVISFIPYVYLITLLGMLTLTLIIAGRMRLASFVSAFRWQSIFLALFVGALGVQSAELGLVATALLVLIVKVYLLPNLLNVMARSSGASQRLSAYFRPATLTFSTLVLCVAAFGVANLLSAVTTSDTLVTAVSFSMLFSGFFLLVSRKDLFGQCIGFLVMENGIFTLSLSLIGGLPLLVDVGILFDVVAGVILMIMLAYRVQKEHASLSTDFLHDIAD